MVLTGDSSDAGLKIWHVPAEGGDAQLVDVGQPAYWAWTPGGEGLLAHLDGSSSEHPGRARVSLLLLGGSVSERRLDLEPVTFQAPSLSPAGDLALVAGSLDGGEPSLLLTTPLGESFTELLPIETQIAFGWSPRGRNAAYIAAEPGQTTLLGRLGLLDLSDPESPVPIETGEALVVAFDWSPDGRHVLSYEPVAGASGEDAQEPVLLFRLNLTDVPSGETRQLGTFRPTQDFVDLLPFFDQYAQSSTAWSPDGRNIVFTSQTLDGQQAVFVLSTSGTVEPRGVAEGVYAVWSWR
jgi:hypothetical protein